MARLLHLKARDMAFMTFGTLGIFGSCVTVIHKYNTKVGKS